MAPDVSNTKLAKECIYTALLQLLEKKPYEHITIQEIVDRAGVSRMAYYRNYESKDDILEDHLEEVLEKHIRRLKRGKQQINDLGFWTDFIHSFRADPLVLALMKAGLTGRLLQHHKQFTVSLYGDILGWDLTDHKNLMNAHYQMGGLVGIIGIAIGGDLPLNDTEFAKIILSHMEVVV